MPTWAIYVLLGILAVVWFSGAVWGIAFERERARRAYRWPCWRCRELELGVKRYTEKPR